MTATTKLPGHLRQQVPGVNSNPSTQEGEAVMPNLQYESTTAEIIANIAKAMKAQGMDAAALSEAADIEETDLLNILALREELHVEDLFRIANALEVDIGDLLPPAGTHPADSRHIDVTEQDEGDGIRLLVAVVHQEPEIHVFREQQGKVRTPWNVSVPYSQVIDRDGDFESADAARAFAEALLNAAKLAKQLEVYGR